MVATTKKVDYKVKGGKLIRLTAEIDGTTIKKIRVCGDFFLHPEEKLLDLENYLFGKSLHDASLKDGISEELKDAILVGFSVDDLLHALSMLEN